MARSGEKRSLSLSRVLVSLIGVALVALIVGVLAGGYVLTDDTADSKAFATETSVQNDSIVHAFEPESEEHHEYTASFRILQEGTEIQNVDEETYELASGDPLVVVIEDRDPQTTYQVEVTIRNAADVVVYDGTLVVSGSA